MKLIYKCLLLVTTCLITQNVFAQDDLLEQLEQQTDSIPQEVSAVFKSTRIILGHSTKLKGKQELEFNIIHRFGRLNTGGYELWGLDNSSIRIGLEYGITDRINVGVGRSSFDKTFDGFLKYKPLAQKTAGMPFSVVAFISATYKTTPKASLAPDVSSTDRLGVVYQILLSRKFNNKLSLQLAPILVTRNQTFDAYNETELWAMGVGGRYKITNKVTLNMEWYPRLNPREKNTDNFDSFSAGVDIDTGGHVFQFHITNSNMTFERAFVAETTDDFWAGDIHFGFNITRTFQL